MNVIKIYPLNSKLIVQCFICEFIKQTLNMVFSFTENCTTCTTAKKGQIENINIRNGSSIYRSDVIYKECSYELPALHLFRPKKKSISALESQESYAIKELRKYNENQDAHNYWLRVNQLPVVERQCKVKKDLQETCEQSSDYNFDTDQFRSLKIENNGHAPHIIIPTDNVATSVASFLKHRQSLKTKVKTWYKNTFPKFVCPCCTGGSDAGAPYHSQTAAGSYESIDLKASSNNALHSLNLDASLMSIINLHRTLKPKRTPKAYAKILGSVLQNTYKNVHKTNIVKSIK